MNKAESYKFLTALVEKYPADAVPMLQDIIVDYLLFPNGDGVETPAHLALSETEREVARLMNEGQKIQAIKYVREQHNLGLKEAKDYVEQRVWPAAISGGKSEKSLEMQQRYVAAVFDKIRKDYNILGGDE